MMHLSLMPWNTARRTSLHIRAAQLYVPVSRWCGFLVHRLQCWSWCATAAWQSEYRHKFLPCKLIWDTLHPTPTTIILQFLWIRGPLSALALFSLNKFNFNHCYIWPSLAQRKLGTAEKNFSGGCYNDVRGFLTQGSIVRHCRWGKIVYRFFSPRWNNPDTREEK